MSEPTATSPQDWNLLINAYLDGELDAQAALEIERRMRMDETLRAEYERLGDLRTVLARHLEKDRASADLERRIAAIAAPPQPHGFVPSRRAFSPMQMAASLALGMVIASGATYLALRPAAPGAEISALIAGHKRALIAEAPFDVASTDQHTVKPWFDARVALSPAVIDLASDGFPLAGGRLDLVNGTVVPTSVYKRRAHLISVVAIPEAGSRDDGRVPAQLTRDGYTVLAWPGQDFRYTAISDVAQGELQDFVRLWRAAAPGAKSLKP